MFGNAVQAKDTDAMRKANIDIGASKYGLDTSNLKVVKFQDVQKAIELYYDLMILRTQILVLDLQHSYCEGNGNEDIWLIAQKYKNDMEIFPKMVQKYFRYW